MAESTLDFRVRGSEQLDALIRRLADADASIPDDAQSALRDLAGRLARTAAERVMLEPTHGAKHTGLRAKVAAGVGVEDTPFGARVTTSMPNSNEAIIPRGFDTFFGGHWRHPLFGDKERWYENFGAFSWFMATMQEGQQEGLAMLTAVLEEAAARIERGA